MYDGNCLPPSSSPIGRRVQLGVLSSLLSAFLNTVPTTQPLPVALLLLLCHMQCSVNCALCRHFENVVIVLDSAVYPEDTVPPCTTFPPPRLNRFLFSHLPSF